MCAIDPESAGWDWTTFHVYRLEPGQRVTRPADDMERLLLVLEGKASLRVGDEDLGVQGSRMSVFDGPPPPVLLVEPGRSLEAVATTGALVAIGAAPGGEVRRTALIAPEDILVEARGEGNTARRIHHLLPPGAEAGRLIAFEVYTPGGNWSSYPPHKHDTENPPVEARLEELYYYKFAKPAQAFAFARVYTADRSLDEALTPDGWRRRPDPRGLPPGRRPGGLRLLLPQRDGRAQPCLVLHPGPGPRVAHELEPGRAEGRGRDRAVTPVDRDAPIPGRRVLASWLSMIDYPVLHDRPAAPGGSQP